MKIVWSPAYEVDIGPHVFPTIKYRLVRERLLASGAVDAGDFLEPEPARWEALARVHEGAWLDKIRTGSLTEADVLRLELPFGPALRDSMLLCCGGTVLAGRRALDDGLCVHLGGGFHHAFPGHGEGFCLLNDVAVAAADVLADGRARRVSVVDLDVHHGNGTAAVFQDEDRVFTFSMHQDRLYPPVKPASDLDVALPDRIGDAEYLDLLERHLPRPVAEADPDLVLYLAGADPYREDQLGGLGLTQEGLARRDRMVLSACGRAGVPVAVLPAGGYARDTRDTVAIHARTVEIALERSGA